MTPHRWVTAPLIVVGLMMTGCASYNTLTMTYLSDPPGATIYQVEDDRNFGRTPAVVEYQLSPEYIREGYVYLKEIRAIWESGAAVQTYDFGRYIPTGRTGTYTFVRPDQAAGRDIDLRFARELKQRLIPAQDGEVLLGPIEENAYGLGIQSDATGRPFRWVPLPQHNPTGFVDPLLKVRPNAYGPGIGMDQ